MIYKLTSKSCDYYIKTQQIRSFVIFIPKDHKGVYIVGYQNRAKDLWIELKLTELSTNVVLYNC